MLMRGQDVMLVASSCTLPSPDHYTIIINCCRKLLIWIIISISLCFITQLLHSDFGMKQEQLCEITRLFRLERRDKSSVIPIHPQLEFSSLDAKENFVTLYTFKAAQVHFKGIILAHDLPLGSEIKSC